MTPVDQTEFGPFRGNCLSACVASLLDLPISEVPTFTDRHAEGGVDWVNGLATWLDARGWGLVIVPWAKQHFLIRSGYVIACGQPRSPCDPDENGNPTMHAVIAKAVMDVTRVGPKWTNIEWRLEWVHDPHPDRAYLESGTVEHLLLLIPSAPGELTFPIMEVHEPPARRARRAKSLSSKIEAQIPPC